MLSPRLHQFKPPALRPGAFFFCRLDLNYRRKIMASYRQTRVLSPLEAAYIAGLIDGEGTISLSRKHRGENRQLVVSISSTEREILAYVQQVVCAGKITRKRTYKTNHSPGLTYVITNRQALSLLAQVSSHLRSYKAKRAALILSKYIRCTPRNGRYTPEQRLSREAFIEEFLNARPDTVPEKVPVG